MDFSRFAGRPWRECRHRAFFATRWRGWREHPCAHLLEAMLDERGLDELDVLITASGPSLAVETPDDVRFLETQDQPFDQAEELAALASNLDHVVAWRLRDRMIAATLVRDGNSGTWVQEPTIGRDGRVGNAWTTPESEAAAPPWAITASTPLLRRLAAVGVSNERALDAACAAGPKDPTVLAWQEVADLTIVLEEGRLHCKSHGVGASVEDRDAFNLLMPEQTLSGTLAIASRGHPLSRIVSFSSPPAVLGGLDPAIVELTEHDDPWWSDFPGLRVTLAVGTETLADIPPDALASIGINAASVPRSVKPWLAPGLRADGKPRRAASAHTAPALASVSPVD